MRFGLKRPDGFLPVYSVADNKEARDLLTLACPRNGNGEYVAPDLVEEQTLENLQKFSDRLHRAHAMLAKHGDCRCKP